MHLVYTKILHNHYLRFLLGRVKYSGEIGNNGYAISFWEGKEGINKVHYGLRERVN